MDWILAIPLVPALIGLVMMPLGRSLRNRLVLLPVAGIVVSTVLSLAVAVSAFSGAHHGEIIHRYAWELGVIDGVPLELSIGLDGMGVVMLLVVTLVSTAVHVYSLSYMGSDKGKGWYYAVLSLFTAAMLGLVMSDNLLLVFGMWELMGLCSYLLIGFWWEDEAPRRASQKAFLTTRIGDLGFLVALFALWKAFGTFDLTTILGAEYSAGLATLVSIGILWAAMGKSAQVPLHVWLPDAMAGPTPSSALIHAATMVAAGVFVVARFLPVFEAAPGVLTAVLVIGSLTAVLAATMAAVQHDIKKVLAYSTISQLGLMFVALGLASGAAALFHLFTHAFFKALLFLASGIIIHAVHTQDMRDMGGLARRMPVTTVIYTIGALALAGVAPLSGFFSKDEILTVALHEHNWFAFAAVALTSLLTAFYMTRLWMRVFRGPAKDDHAHDGDALMTAPVAFLALVTLVAGFTFIPMAELIGEHGAWPQPLVAGISTAVALSGIGLGYLVYGRASHPDLSTEIRRALGPLYVLPERKWFFDEVYSAVFIKGFITGSKATYFFDAHMVDGVVNAAGRAWKLISTLVWRFDALVVDGFVNAAASVSRFFGSGFRALQTGRLQTYQRYVIVALVAFMVYLVVKGA